MKKVAILVKDSRDAQKSARRLTQALQRFNVVVSMAKTGGDRKEIRKILSHCQLIIAVGGDGTILHSARLAAPYGIPLLGVNLGRLGFLSEVDLKGAIRSLRKILAGEYLLDPRMMIQASVLRKGRAITDTLALNDVVIGKAGISRMIRADCYTNRNLI